MVHNIEDFNPILLQYGIKTRYLWNNEEEKKLVLENDAFSIFNEDTVLFDQYYDHQIEEDKNPTLFLEYSNIADLNKK